SFTDLSQPKALIPRSKEWWLDRVHWSAQEKRWTFPSGATLTFGYLERDDDVYQYQSAEYQYIGFDELTQHTEFRYRYLFSRLRRPAGLDVPLRMRGATNPGGRGHEWVKRRFITRPERGRGFVPAQLDDNPSPDRDEDLRSLAGLDPVTRAQLLAGDWDAYAGGRFRKEWFKTYRGVASPEGPRWVLQNGEPRGVMRSACSVYVICDPAASEKTTADYTAIGVFGVTP